MTRQEFVSKWRSAELKERSSSQSHSNDLCRLLGIVDPHAVAHFVNRLVFCMFAEDAGLLPDKMFEWMIKAGRPKPETFAALASTLFAAMKTGGMVGFVQVEWFNGGLFDSDDALPLIWEDMDDLIRASGLDWSGIDPSILGTLFEQGIVRLLRRPINVNGRPNSEVVRRWSNGMDVTRRPAGRWIIDFGTDTPLDDAAVYEAPFEIVTRA